LTNQTLPHQGHANEVKLIGTLITEPTVTHQIYDEHFYRMEILVNRLSATADTLIVQIPERILAPGELETLKLGITVEIDGEFRSLNREIDGKNALDLFIHANTLKIVPDDTIHLNQIHLIGAICKKVASRQTLTGRVLADVMLATNRHNFKTNYLPCIVWGRNANYLTGVNVGTKVEFYGRVQSRPYIKHLPDGSELSKVAYEVSVSRVGIVD
jgi:hypothetical protein